MVKLLVTVKIKFMKKKRKHTTTKNTVPKNPITRLAEYTLDVNGIFTITTNLTDEKIFDKHYREWFDHPSTFMWCGESLVAYLNANIPKYFFYLKEDFDKIVDAHGGYVPATKEEWEAENN